MVRITGTIDYSVLIYVLYFAVASANPTPLGTRNPTPFGLTRNPTPLRQRREPSVEPSTASLAPTKGVPKDQTENPTPFEFGEITENPTPRLWGDLTENPTPVDFIGEIFFFLFALVTRPLLTHLFRFIFLRSSSAN